MVKNKDSSRKEKDRQSKTKKKLKTKDFGKTNEKTNMAG